MTDGATVSTVHVAVAGEASVLPASSVAATLTLWRPSARPESSSGDAQSAAAPPSTTQLNVAGVSVAENVIDADADATVPLGAEMVVSGGVRSGAAAVVKVQVWSVARGLPATSVTPPAPPRTVAV